MRTGYLIPISIFLCLAAIFGLYLDQVGRQGKDIHQLPSMLIDKPAPQFALPGIGGKGPGFRTADLLGKISLVNIFASWCPPCRAEHPLLMRLAKDGVQIFGINYKDKPEDARAFLAELGSPYIRVGADENGLVSVDWGVTGYPETFVVDREGRVRLRHVGPISADDLESVLRPLMRKLRR